MREKIEYFIVLVFLYLAKILPISWLYGLFDFLSVLLFKILKKRRELAIKNISLAYEDFSQKQAYELAKKNFQSIGKTVTQTLLLYHNKYDINKNIVNADEAMKKIKALGENEKNGVIILSMHFGNWELLAQYLAFNGFSSMGIGREGNNKLIETKITLPFRGKYGNINVYKKQAMVKLIKALRKNGKVGLLMDQKEGHKNGIKTTFFKRPCLTTSSVATIVLKYNPQVIPIFIKRLENELYEVLVPTPKLDIDENLTQEKKLIYITQTYNDTLEEIIKQAPEQWFWMHDRWKYA